MSRFTKWMCEQCNWKGYEHQLLLGCNPFNPDEEITGCPECKIIEQFMQTCDEPNCWLEAGCGTPFGLSGYKRHCHKHPPVEPKAENWGRKP